MQAGTCSKGEWAACQLCGWNLILPKLPQFLIPNLLILIFIFAAVSVADKLSPDVSKVLQIVNVEWLPYCGDGGDRWNLENSFQVSESLLV